MKNGNKTEKYTQNHIYWTRNEEEGLEDFEINKAYQKLQRQRNAADNLSTCSNG